MARRIRDRYLDTRESRRSLLPRGKPYYRAIGARLHLGYRKGKGAGRWVLRSYSDGSYQVATIADADDVLDANGHNVLTFWQAQDRIRQLIAAPLTAKIAAPFTVADAIAEYLDWIESRGKPSKDTRQRAEAFILPAFGKVEVSKLTTTQIRKWLRELADTPVRLRTSKYAPQKYKQMPDDPETIRRRRATANRTLTTLKAALNRAWRESEHRGQFLSDGAWRRVEPFENVDAARVRFLTVDEARSLINACEPSFRQLVLAALQTGARYGELAALRVADFDPDNHTVFIQTSKSGKSRQIELTDEGVAFFKSVTIGRRGDEVMFCSATGGRFGKSHQTRPMAIACERAKLSPPISFHGLRHTWASLAVMGGMPLMVVSKNLGHADTRMVEKHYGHMRRDYLKKMINDHAPRFGIIQDQTMVSIRSER
jgi:integrase